MAKYERKPSVDEICRMILARGAVEVRAWVEAHPDKADLVESYARSFYEAEAPGCWVLFSEEDEDEIEAIVIRLPDDPNGRRRCRTALNEYMYMVSDVRELDDYIDDVDHYFGQEYCWLRSFD